MLIAAVDLAWLYQSEKLAGMGSLLAGVAHELNNPLSVVLGRTRMLGQLAGSGPSATRRASLLRHTLSSARRRPARAGRPDRRR